MNVEARFTCQICGRSIKAKNGSIAHHGYRRPGEGWQTSSCMGARYAPLEVSYDVLEPHVAGVAREVAHKEALVAEPIKMVRLTVEGKRIPNEWIGGRAKREIGTTYEVTAENFDSIKEANRGHFAMHSIYRFDTLVEKELFKRRRLLKEARSYFTWQSERLAARKALDVVAA